MGFRDYPPELKAEVVLEVINGKSIGKIARERKITQQTIRKWRDQSGLFTGHHTNKNEQSLDESVLELIDIGLETLKNQLRVTGRLDWIEKQGAEHLYLLHGVTFDKLFRLLAALERARGNQERMEIDSTASPVAAE